MRLGRRGRIGLLVGLDEQPAEGIGLGGADNGPVQPVQGNCASAAGQADLVGRPPRPSRPSRTHSRARARAARACRRRHRRSASRSCWGRRRCHPGGRAKASSLCIHAPRKVSVFSHHLVLTTESVPLFRDRSRIGAVCGPPPRRRCPNALRNPHKPGPRRAVSDSGARYPNHRLPGPVTSTRTAARSEGAVLPSARDALRGVPPSAQPGWSRKRPRAAAATRPASTSDDTPAPHGRYVITATT